MKHSLFLTLAFLAGSLFASRSTLAGSTQVTFDPSAAGLAGSAFTFDALQGEEISRIDNTFDMFGGLTFVENGYLKLTGATLGGSGVTTGLNSAYTLYLQFSLAGGTASLSIPGTISSGTMTLYGVNGVSTFGFDGGNHAIVDNGSNTPVSLFSSAIIGGTIGSTIVSFPPPVLDLSATAAATVVPIQAGFISSPGGSPLLLNLLAAHDHSTVTVLDGGNTFLVNGGPDVITFHAVPEPSTVALVGVGLATMIVVRRRTK